MDQLQTLMQHPQASRIMEIAGRLGDGGFRKSGQHIGSLLLERERPKSPEEQFVVHPFEANPWNLMKKGFKWPPLAMGDVGPDGDPRGLFAAAKGQHPERAAEFQAEIDKCNANFQSIAESAGKHVPSAEEKRQLAAATLAAQAASAAAGGVMAETLKPVVEVLQQLAAKVGLGAEEVAEAAPEPPPKRSK